MTQLDFTNLTTDELLATLPPTETREWEYKAADIFDKSNFGEFKKQKLGKTVSAFANSGGGFLLLGKRDDSDVFEPVPTHQVRMKMEDHLSLAISESVTPHYKDFDIHRVSISGSPGKSVLVVAFDDSQLAPHQSVSDTNYYYRLPGHSVPAPHFYLESLRNRSNKAVVVIDGTPTFAISFPFIPCKKWPDQLLLSVEMTVNLRNISPSMSADHYALRVFGDEAMAHWFIGKDDAPLCPSTEVKGVESPLLPTSTTTMKIAMRTPVGKLSPLSCRSALGIWERLVFSVKPLSQNFSGEVRTFHPFRILGDQALPAYQRAFDERVEQEQRFKENARRMAKQIQKYGEGIQGIQLGLSDALNRH